MKYKPTFKTMEEIALSAGFVSANRGWAIQRKRQSCKPTQYHIVPTSDGYDVHADYEKEGKHVSEKMEGRDKKFIEIFDALDRGETPTITISMAKKYPTLPKNWNYCQKTYA